MARNTWLDEQNKRDDKRLLERHRNRKKVTREDVKSPTLEHAKNKIKLLQAANNDMANKPTAAQLRMWGEVFEIGCIACHMEGVFSFPEIHHVKEYGYRNHDKVYGLCPRHHKDTSKVPGVPNRHGTPKEFEAKYGTDQELFEICQKLRGVVE